MVTQQDRAMGLATGNLMTLDSNLKQFEVIGNGQPRGTTVSNMLLNQAELLLGIARVSHGDLYDRLMRAEDAYYKLAVDAGDNHSQQWAADWTQVRSANVALGIHS